MEANFHLRKGHKVRVAQTRPDVSWFVLEIGFEEYGDFTVLDEITFFCRDQVQLAQVKSLFVPEATIEEEIES